MRVNKIKKYLKDLSINDIELNELLIDRRDGKGVFINEDIWKKKPQTKNLEIPTVEEINSVDASDLELEASKNKKINEVKELKDKILFESFIFDKDSIPYSFSLRLQDMFIIFLLSETVNSAEEFDWIVTNTVSNNPEKVTLAKKELNDIVDVIKNRFLSYTNQEILKISEIMQLATVSEVEAFDINFETNVLFDTTLKIPLNANGKFDLNHLFTDR